MLKIREFQTNTMEFSHFRGEVNPRGSFGDTILLMNVTFCHPADKRNTRTFSDLATDNRQNSSIFLFKSYSPSNIYQWTSANMKATLYWETRRIDSKIHRLPIPKQEILLSLPNGFLSAGFCCFILYYTSASAQPGLSSTRMCDTIDF